MSLSARQIADAYYRKLLRAMEADQTGNVTAETNFNEGQAVSVQFNQGESCRSEDALKSVGRKKP